MTDSNLFSENEIKKAMEYALRLTEEMKRLKKTVSVLEQENSDLKQQNEELRSVATAEQETKRNKSSSNIRNVSRIKLEELSTLSSSQVTPAFRSASLSPAPQPNQPTSIEQAISPRGASSASWINIAELRSELNERQRELFEVKEERERNKIAFFDLKKHNEFIQRQLDGARDMMDTLRSKVTTLEHICQEKEQLYSDIETKYTALRQERNSLLKRLRERELNELSNADQISEKIELLQIENANLLQQNMDLKRILDETREELFHLREVHQLSLANSVEVVISNENQEKEQQQNSPKTTPTTEEDDRGFMLDLISERFTEHLQLLEEQLLHTENHLMMNSRETSTHSSGNHTQTPLEGYFKLIVLSIKVQLSSQDRYDPIWYHIWFIDSGRLYTKVLKESISWHNWYTWAWNKCQSKLEKTLLKSYADGETKSTNE